MKKLKYKKARFIDTYWMYSKCFPNSLVSIPIHLKPGYF